LEPFIIGPKESAISTGVVRYTDWLEKSREDAVLECLIMNINAHTSRSVTGYTMAT
jgi:hypothetical protein